MRSEFPLSAAAFIQTAVKLVLEPIFEADFEDSTYGYRPRHSAADAIKETHRLICRGYTDVVDADLSKYFDTIPPFGPPQIGGPAHRGPAKLWLKAAGRRAG